MPVNSGKDLSGIVQGMFYPGNCMPGYFRYFPYFEAVNVFKDQGYLLIERESFGNTSEAKVNVFCDLILPVR